MFEKKIIFSEYELILTDSRSVYSIRALWDDLTHTPVMPTRPASAVWGIYRPFSLIHPHTHPTHTHTPTHNTHTHTTEGEARRVSTLTHRKTQHGYRIHPQVTPQWSELETVWERHLSDRDVCLTVSLYINIHEFALKWLKSTFLSIRWTIISTNVSV